MANISNIDFIKIGIDQNGVVHYVNASGAWDILPLGGSGDCCTEGTPFVGFDVSDVVPRPIDGKVNFGITTSGNLATKSAVGVQQYFVPTGDVKRYKAIISQTSIDETNGLLVIGEEYVIDSLEAGDDFTNVGYVSEGVIFTATGTTPTNWSNGSTVLFLTQSQPVINNEIFNTIPNLTVSFGNDGSGNYKILFQTSGLFLANKTFFTQINLQRISDNLLAHDSGSFISIEFELYP
jgi:hypothetical protein